MKHELLTLGPPAWTVPGEVVDPQWLDERRVLVMAGHQLVVVDCDERRVLQLGPDCASTWAARLDAQTVLFSDKQDVILWDLASGAQRTLSVPGWWTFYAGAASPDGARLALASSQGSALLVDRASGEVLWEREVAERELTCVAFSRDGEWVAFGAAGGGLTVLRTEDGERLRQIAPMGFNQQELLLSRDGNRLVMLAERGLYVLDTHSWELVWSDEHHGPYQGFWSSDGTVLYCVYWGSLRAWRAADGLLLGTLEHEFDQAALSPDGSRMLVSRGQRLGLFAIREPDPALWQLDPRDGTDPVAVLAFSLDGNALYTGSHRYTLRDGDRQPLALPSDPKSQALKIQSHGAIAWSTPEGTGYAAVPEAEPRFYPGQGELQFDASGRPVLRRTDRQLYRTDPLGQDLEPVFLGYGKHHFLVLLSPDGKKVAVSTRKRGWEIWDLEREQLLTASRRADAYFYRGLWLDPDTLVLDHPSRDEGLVVLHAETLEIRRALQGPAKGFRLFTDSRGQRVGLQDQRAVVLWDARTGERLAQLARPPLDVLDARLSPDGTRCAVSFADCTVTVWEI